MRKFGWLTVALALAPGAAEATWSIVAVDPDTREVGVAGASCIGGVEVIAGLAPGKGAIAAQAFASQRGRNRGVAMLLAGESPRAVLEAVAGPRFDAFFLPLYRLRQYGVVALGFEDASAAYTGSWTFGWAGAAQGPGVSVQGNLLVGPEVVEAALSAFQAERAFALADRLLAALEAGAERGGDRRCSKEQSALSAILAVARQEDEPGAPTLRIVIPKQDKGGANPVVLLREKYEAWRGTFSPTAGVRERAP